MIDLVYVLSPNFEKYSKWYIYHARQQRVKCPLIVPSRRLHSPPSRTLVATRRTKEVVLFSIHIIFRTGEMQQIDNNCSFYQMDLNLASDCDPQLRTLAERIREETPDSTKWERLGQLLLKLSQ